MSSLAANEPSEYGFELLVDASGFASPVEHALDAIHDAGLDDALVTWRGDRIVLHVDRVASSPVAAIVEAIGQVDAIPGLRVVRVSPLDLVGVAEIARRKGKTKQWASLVVAGKRGPAGFPAPFPLEHLATPMWRWADVIAWLDHGTKPSVVDIERSALAMSTINALLDLRKFDVDETDRAALAPLLRQAHGA